MLTQAQRTTIVELHTQGVSKHEIARVLGISCVTNVLHRGPSEDTHEDVLATAAETGPRFINLVRGVVKALPAVPAR